MKGEILPTIPDLVNMTVREPYGVCARIVAYNHPLMFAAQRIGAPLITGNTIILKPPPQAPLSAYRLMELLDGVVPPGVLNMVSGGRTCGAALATHKKIPVVSLIGSVESGKACNTARAPAGASWWPWRARGPSGRGTTRSGLTNQFLAIATRLSTTM